MLQRFLLAFLLIAPCWGDTPWQPLFLGVDYRLETSTQPRPIRVHQIRIDTHAKGISFFTTPDNGDKPGEVDGRRTSTFLKEFDLEVAINGTGFQPITTEGKPVDILGLSISDGRKVSDADLASANPVFLVTAKNEPRILRAPLKPQDWTNADDALQGWYGANGMLLDDGKIVTATRDIHPRTAIGISKESRYVYLVVVDGRQPGFSEGIQLVELAGWMKKIGCWNAMNLDGGGSSTLVTRNPDGTPRILNSIPGKVQRSVANHLGIHARPLSPARDPQAD